VLVRQSLAPHYRIADHEEFVFIHAPAPVYQAFGGFCARGGGNARPGMLE